MPRIEIDKERCKGCQLCMMYCPCSCIKLGSSLNERGVYPVLFSDRDRCTGCSFCAIVCPDLCITVYK